MFGYDEEAVIQDADIEMAELVEGGIIYYQRLQASKKAAGEERVRLCPHGGGYILDSLAAEREGDPRAGEEGYRCSDCRGVLSAFPYEDGGYKILYVE
jgi:hypothetical protein